jgi:very-short-patch-repair endonuclease/predicted transcriptional regulator of viral defense system
MPAEPAISPGSRGKSQARHPDWLIAESAERQHGVVSRPQLIELGVSEGGIDLRIHRGYLHRLHSGVYAVGQRQLRTEGMLMAAVLAGGPDAVLSHRSAAVHWGILRRDRGRRIEISTPTARRHIGDVRRHQVRHVTGETGIRKGIPITSLRRTIVDISGAVPVPGLEAAIREAQYRHGIDSDSLRRLLQEYRGHRGIARLRASLDNLGVGPRGRTRSPLEDRFASLLAGADIRQPELNVLVDIGGHLIEADCLWSEDRVIIELDGGAEHGTDAAFQSDRARDRRLQALGWKVGRVTHEHLDQPEAVLADIRRMLNGDQNADPAISPG